PRPPPTFPTRRSSDLLSRPAMLNFRCRDNFLHFRQPPVVTSFRRRALAGFLILSAENDVIKISLRIDPQVIVWLFHVPKKRCWQATRRNAGTQDIAAVEGKLGLKQSGCSHIGQADQGIVRQDRDAIECDPMIVRLYPSLFGVEF